jgi:hypothetical protein
MPPFEYQPYRNVYAQSLADLMMQGGQAQAQGLQQAGQEIAQGQRGAGQAWGQMLSGLGTTIGELPQQQQQAQLRQAQMQDLAAQAQVRQAQVRDLQRKESGRQAMAATLPTYTTYDATGKPVIDNQGFANDLIQQGFSDEGNAWIKSSAENAKDLEALADVKRTHDLKVAQTFGDLAFNSNSPDEFQAGVTRAVALGLLDHDQAAKMTAALDSPNGWPTLYNNLVQFSPQWLEQQKQYREVRLVPSDTRLMSLDRPPGGLGMPAVHTLVEGVPKPGTLEDLIDANKKGDEPRVQALLTAWKQEANAKRDQGQLDQIKALRDLTMQARQQALDDARDKNQDKLEKTYDDMFKFQITSRSGQYGVNDAKANQGIQLRTLLDRYRDPATGDPTPLPPTAVADLTVGLARLFAPTAAISEELAKRFDAPTLEGVAAKAIQYYTGSPTTISGTPAQVRLMLEDLINLEGQKADELRQHTINNVKARRPTGLDAWRAEHVESGVEPEHMPAPYQQPGAAKEGDVKPVPGHPGQTAIYKNGRWVIP